MAGGIIKKNKIEEIKQKIEAEEKESGVEEQEDGWEQGAEKEDEALAEEERKQISEQISEQAGSVETQKASGGVSARQARQKEVENILEEDLKEIYLSLDPQKKVEFKEKGEETAKQINQLLDQAKIKVKKIIFLIKKWLSVVPGINKIFLEQEAKIKADQITKLKDK